jgi:hypothetical protein
MIGNAKGVGHSQSAPHSFGVTLHISSHPGATVNQHPPAHHEGWMGSGQETIFCWVPVA